MDRRASVPPQLFPLFRSCCQSSYFSFLVRIYVYIVYKRCRASKCLFCSVLFCCVCELGFFTMPMMNCFCRCPGDKGVSRSRSTTGLSQRNNGLSDDDDIHRILQHHQPDVDYELPSNSSYAGKLSIPCLLFFFFHFFETNFSNFLFLKCFVRAGKCV